MLICGVIPIWAAFILTVTSTEITQPIEWNTWTGRSNDGINTKGDLGLTSNLDFKVSNASNLLQAPENHPTPVYSDSLTSGLVNCLTNLSLPCVKDLLVDRFVSLRKISLIGDTVSIVRVHEVTIGNDTLVQERENAISDRENPLQTIVDPKLDDYFDNHALRIQLPSWTRIEIEDSEEPPKIGGVLDLRLGNFLVEEGRGKKGGGGGGHGGGHGGGGHGGGGHGGGGGKGGKKMMMALKKMMGLMMKGKLGMMVPMMMGSAKFMAMKGMMVGMSALMLTIIVKVMGMLGGGGGGKMKGGGMKGGMMMPGPYPAGGGCGGGGGGGGGSGGGGGCGGGGGGGGGGLPSITYGPPTGGGCSGGNCGQPTPPSNEYGAPFGGGGGGGGVGSSGGGGSFGGGGGNFGGGGGNFGGGGSSFGGGGSSFGGSGGTAGGGGGGLSDAYGAPTYTAGGVISDVYGAPIGARRNGWSDSYGSSSNWNKRSVIFDQQEDYNQAYNTPEE